MLAEISSGEGCLNISNIVTKSGLDHPYMSQYPTNSVEGIGFFTKNNSLFPLEKGIALSTGNVLNTPGPKTVQDQSSGSTFWPGDVDLNNLLSELGIDGETLHASSLEFNFTSETNYFSIDYIFASDEYGNRCNNHDLVAFFLTDTETEEKINIARVPETNDIISVVTIRNGQYQQFPINCNSNNIDYFENYYDGISPESLNAPINFKGNTSIMTAQTTVIPQRTYHLKIVIGEQKNGFTAGPGGVIYSDPYDTAVFISNIKSIPDQVNLGEDFLTSNNTALCQGSSTTITSNLNSENYTFEWYKDNILIINENQNSITINTPGIYRIKAYYQDSSCYIEDDIKVEFYPELLNGLTLPSIEVCAFNNTTVESVDITIYESIIKETAAPQNIIITYHESKIDAFNGTNKINNPKDFYTNKLPITIYIRVVNNKTNCVEIIELNIESTESSFPITFEKIVRCYSYTLPILPDNNFYSTEENGLGEILNSGYTFQKGNYNIYINSKNDLNCIFSTLFEIEINDCIIPKGISPNGDGVNDNWDLSTFYPKELKIMNRYGQEVFGYKTGYSNQWYGQDNNGKLLPDGTYFYKFVSLYENVTYTGYIYILKQKK